MGQTNGIAGLIDLISGGAFSRFSLFAMSITPYITASIVIQLLAMIIPSLEKLTKEGGEQGRQKINRYTKILTIVLALVEGIGIYLSYRGAGIFVDDSFLTGALVVTGLVTGTSVLMWLGEQITAKGIGNGISIVLLINILSRVPVDFITLYENFVQGKSIAWATVAWIIIFAVIIFVVVLVLILNGGERRISVQYSKKIVGRRTMGGQSSHIPLKVNTSGVIPIIFASSLIMFPEMIIQFAGAEATAFGVGWSEWVGSNGYLYPLIMFILIIFFAYFYSQIQFNPDDVAQMLQQNGGFLQGIRPGQATAAYLRKVNNRLTLFGALFLAFIALIPTLILQWVDGFADLGLGNAFSATGLLIVVSTALEFQKQLESQLLVKNNKGFLK